MKRGLIAWDKAELPPSAFESRISAARKTLADRDLPALVIYSDVCRSNHARHFTNFMPYWNRALAVLPLNGKPILLCALSPRVYPWIRSVTVFEDIRNAGNLSQKLLELCSEMGWHKIGTLDFPGFPADLASALQAGNVAIVDVPQVSVWPALDTWELAMHRKAAACARKFVESEFPQATGCADFEFAARLEREYRRAGAEDVVILLTNGDTVPRPPSGTKVTETSSVTVALEYRGHWAKISRLHPNARAASAIDRSFHNCLQHLQPRGESNAYFETLSGPYPFQPSTKAKQAPGSLFVLHVELQMDGRRFFYGDIVWHTQGGPDLLL